MGVDKVTGAGFELLMCIHKPVGRLTGRASAVGQELTIT